jgi:MFS family permease
MTTTSLTAPAPVLTRPRPRLVTYPLLLRFATMLGASISFYLLLSVVPLDATASAGSGAAGLATGALMVATVAGEAVTPRLVARFGYRLMLAAGLILLGAPSLALIGPAGIALITAVCVVRGLGFAIMVVAGGSLTASLIPPERRGEGLALVGVVAGVPALAALPAGVWLAGRAGYPIVFIAGAAASLAALAAVPGLPGRDRGPAARPDSPAAQPAAQGDSTATQPDSAAGLVAALRDPALRRLAIVFAATTTAAGIIVTFVPLLLASASGALTATALFAQAAAATLTRYLVGRYGDRHGVGHLVIPALVVSSAGIALLAVPGGPAAVVGGCVIFGAGFGIAQNVTLSLMYARAPAASYTAVSALWNMAYDAGMGAGAALFGLLAGPAGYPAAFAVTAAAMLAALSPAVRDRRRSR